MSHPCVLVVEPGTGVSRFANDRVQYRALGSSANSMNSAGFEDRPTKRLNLVLPHVRGFPVQHGLVAGSENSNPFGKNRNDQNETIAALVLVVEQLETELLDPIEKFLQTTPLLHKAKDIAIPELIFLLIEPSKAAASSTFFSAEPSSFIELWLELAKRYGGTCHSIPTYGTDNESFRASIEDWLDDHVLTNPKPRRHYGGASPVKSVLRRGSSTKWFQKTKSQSTISEEIASFTKASSHKVLTGATSKITKQSVRDHPFKSMEGRRVEILGLSETVKDAAVVRDKHQGVGIVKLKYLDLDINLDLAIELNTLEKSMSSIESTSLLILEPVPAQIQERIIKAVASTPSLAECVLRFSKFDASSLETVYSIIESSKHVTHLRVEASSLVEDVVSIAASLTLALQSNLTLKKLSLDFPGRLGVEAQETLQPLLDANKMLANVLSNSELPEEMPFFSRQLQEQKNQALVRCTVLGKFAAIPQLLDCGACGSARTEDNLLCHTVVLKHCGRSASITKRDIAVHAIKYLLMNHWEFDAIARQLLDDPGRFEALCSIVQELSRSRFRAGNEGTVIHLLLDTCLSRTKTLRPLVVRKLCEIALQESDEQYIYSKNLLGQTPRDMALSLGDEFHGIRCLFVEILFTRYRLDSISCLYRSESSCVWKCTDISASKSSQDTVIKLCKFEDHWNREIASRTYLSQNANDDISDSVVSVLAACSVKESIDSTEICVRDGITIVLSNMSDATQGSAKAAKLLSAYPFGLIMPRGQLNLLEASSKYELAKGPLEELRRIARQIGICVQQMHNKGIIHGDLKPRNIVSLGSQYKLLDLDMAASFDPISGRLSDLATCKQLSSAYMTPEMFQLYNCGTYGKSLNGLLNPQQIDIWAFATTVFELLAGKPLISSTYDVVEEIGEKQLLQWSGISPSDKRLIQRHGERETVAVLDLLEWCLECEPLARPLDMDTVLGHAFFSPETGALREHIAVQEIRTALDDPNRSVKIPKTIMISYCWESTPFVLQLCRDLAPIVSNLMLDRLGGDRGMDDWVQESMKRMVSSADVVISVVSKGYVRSMNCALEMQLAHQYSKRVIPINLEFEHRDWVEAVRELGPLGNKIQMQDQYATPEGDGKLYVDFRDRLRYSTKFRHELLPRLLGRENENDETVTEEVSSLADAMRLISKLRQEILSLKSAQMYGTSV